MSERPQHCLKPSNILSLPSSMAQPFSSCQVPQTQALQPFPRTIPQKAWTNSAAAVTITANDHSSQQKHLGIQTAPGAGKS